MRIEIIKPSKVLNKAYFKQSLKREQIEAFKTNLRRLFERVNEQESEEHLKNIVSDFLKDTYYKHTNEINTKGRKDLVIHNGQRYSDAVAVILEAKKPTSPEMISPTKPNAKALHELLHYYLNERFINNNKELKYLIITNIWEWYIFDAQDFEKLFFENKQLLKEYENWHYKSLVGTTTDWFYEQIAKPFIEKKIEVVAAAYFDLKKFEKIICNANKKDDDALIDLYKILSPEHLLKKSFANDSNSLNKEFYNELLHIIGLEETKEGSKKLIQRKKEDRRNEGSLLENTISVLKRNNRYSAVVGNADATENEIYSIALELCIAWLNRILFLKLMEGQLIQYHNGNEAYKFLNQQRVQDFDELDELFFDVLAVPEEKRNESVKSKFRNIPYLNSSLFEETELEKKTVYISALKDRLEIPVFSNTVLKDANGKRIGGSKNTLHYLFEFLGAYDFASDAKANIQEQNKTIINASVLGLIFEKINGYKDGSFFTPGFITMYMCSETVRRAVVQKLKDSAIAAYKNILEFDELKDKIEYTDKAVRRQANELINSLHICDPAVGSGHFLVSALNEIIAIKHELHILSYGDGTRIKGYTISVANDELIITNEETDELFAYTLNQNNKPISEKQQLQETLFHEKQTIIENCLFGVDINPKSVMICRLRLWIELLKNAYYIKESQQLQTLPNIDINIKCGNSLISRFALDADLSKVFRNEKYSHQAYFIAVSAYKDAKDKAAKQELKAFLDDIKQQFLSTILKNHPYQKKLSDKRADLVALDYTDLFGLKKKTEVETEKEKKRLQKEIEELEQKVEEYKNAVIYKDAFEWRFEFPEVLDEDGNYAGFDVVIGNPPYGVNFNKTSGSHYEERYKTFNWRGESYVLFVERATKLLRQNGEFSFIMPDTILNLGFTEAIRLYILKQSRIQQLVSLPSNVFNDATVDTILLFFNNHTTNKEYNNSKVQIKLFNKKRGIDDLQQPDKNLYISAELWYNSKTFNIQGDIDDLKIIEKVDNKFSHLEDYAEMFSGIKAYEVGKGNPPQTEEIRNSKPYTSNRKENDNWAPFFDGKHIAKYELLWKGNNWINYGPWLAAPRSPENFSGEKILIRKIVNDTLVATFISYTCYCNTLLFVLKLIPAKSLISYRALLGIINSKFMGWYFRKKFQISNEDTFPQIMIRDILQFTVPNISNTVTNNIENLVDQILAAKKENPQADTSIWEREIDDMVYKLYGFTEDEIKIVEGA